MCECLYSLFKMLTCHYLIGGVNSWFYTKTGPNVTPFLNLRDKIRDMLKSPCMLYWLLLFSIFSFFNFGLKHFYTFLISRDLYLRGLLLLLLLLLLNSIVERGKFESLTFFVKNCWVSQTQQLDKTNHIRRLKLIFVNWWVGLG